MAKWSEKAKNTHFKMKFWEKKKIIKAINMRILEPTKYIKNNSYFNLYFAPKRTAITLFIWVFTLSLEAQEVREPETMHLIHQNWMVCNEVVSEK